MPFIPILHHFQHYNFMQMMRAPWLTQYYKLLAQSISTLAKCPNHQWMLKIKTKQKTWSSRTYLQGCWFIFLKIYLFKKKDLFILEREKGGQGTEGEIISSRLSTEHRALQGLSLTTLRLWPEPKSRVGCWTNWAPLAPPEMLTELPQIVRLNIKIIHYLPWRF